jgi:elongation factor Ts
MTTIELIKQLREVTGAGVQDCRKALEQANANYALALVTLREQAAAAAARRADRPAAQGVVELYAHGNGRIGVMVEVNSETDFAAQADLFRQFAHELALQIAAAAPAYIRDEDIPAEELACEAEKASQRARAEGKPETIIPRIVAGVLNKYKNDKVLLRQVYIRDDSLTVAQLLSRVSTGVGENIVIRRFIRWELDENPEKPQMNTDPRR